MKFRLISVVATAILWHGSCNANDLITQPEAAIYIAPPVYNGQFTNRMGDTTIPNPSWNIGQFGNPQPFTSGTDYSASAGSNWAFGTNTSRVQFYSSPSSGVLENTLQLAQNGVGLTCGTEFDLFAGSNLPQFYKDQNGNPVASRIGLSAPIGSLSSVQYQLGLNIVFEGNNGGCPLNYVAYVEAVNLVSTNGYSIYFQVIFRDSREITANNTGCPSFPQGKVYCFDTTIDQLGAGLSQQAANGSRVAYNFNVLNQLKAAIAKTPDTDSNNWQINNTYFGSLIQGGAVPASNWDSFKLTTYQQ